MIRIEMKRSSLTRMTIKQIPVALYMWIHAIKNTRIENVDDL